VAGTRATFVQRVGLALVAPRWALAVADDPRHPGRPGTDLVRLLVGVILCVQTRALVGAAWLGAVAGASIGGRALLRAVADPLTLPLVLLVAATGVLWLGGGPRRAVGRAFDLACVALVPLVVVELVGTLLFRAALDASPPVRTAALGIGFAWAGALVALALVQMRRPPGALARAEAT